MAEHDPPVGQPQGSGRFHELPFLEGQYLAPHDPGGNHPGYPGQHEHHVPYPVAQDAGRHDHHHQGG